MCQEHNLLMRRDEQRQVLFMITDEVQYVVSCEIILLSMVIALSMSRACQPHSGALLLCMVVSDSIHRTCKSDVSAL
jgi:hypothetical protein